jgi:hypothetical protein
LFTLKCGRSWHDSRGFIGGRNLGVDSIVNHATFFVLLASLVTPVLLADGEMKFVNFSKKWLFICCKTVTLNFKVRIYTPLSP